MSVIEYVIGGVIILVSLIIIFPTPFGFLQFHDRTFSLTGGGFMVKRVASFEPRVKHGVFLIQKTRKRN